MDPQEGFSPISSLSQFLPQHCQKLKMTLGLGTREPGLLKTWILLFLKDKMIHQKTELV